MAIKSDAVGAQEVAAAYIRKCSL